MGKIFVYSWRANKWTFLALIISSVLLCMAQVFEIVMLQEFFDGITAFAMGALSKDAVIRMIVFLAILFLLTPVVEVLEYLAQGYFWRRGDGFMSWLFHAKVGEKRLEEFNQAKTFDTMEKAKIGTENLPAAARAVIQSIFYFIPFFVLTSGYLFSVAPLLAVILIVLYVTILFSEKYKASQYYQFEDTTVNLKRKVAALADSIVSKEFFKETRTLGAYRYLDDRYKKEAEIYSKEKRNVEHRIIKRETVFRLINTVGYMLVIGLLLYYLIQGRVSVGIFAAIYYSIDKINRTLKNMSSQIGETMQNIATTDFLFEFLDQQEEEKAVLTGLKNKDICFKNVSFRYGDSNKEVLKHLNLTIPAGESLAIVGENGAGKSTFTKLITGLFKPTEGEVLYGGHATSEYSLDSLYRYTSGVFQDFSKYKMTLRDNIRISDMESDTPIDEVVRVANINLGHFSEGYDTMVSRDFGGTDISGGEWQRVAIARGLYRSCDLIILDEPTAAIDPLEESRIFRLFEEATKGKTTILVTHRLGSVKLADKIVVLNHGEIAEYGTHEELMEKEGLYYTMYSEQAKWYER